MFVQLYLNLSEDLLRQINQLVHPQVQQSLLLLRPTSVARSSYRIQTTFRRGTTPQQRRETRTKPSNYEYLLLKKTLTSEQLTPLPHKTETHRWMEPHSEKEEMVEPHDSPSKAPQESIVTTLKLRENKPSVEEPTQVQQRNETAEQEFSQRGTIHIFYHFEPKQKYPQPLCYILIWWGWSNVSTPTFMHLHQASLRDDPLHQYTG